ncbi:hypothetical protein D6V10_21220, partial [Vibrio cholerae]|nr:hypothetical protein [Vibrio cholerae]
GADRPGLPGFDSGAGHVADYVQLRDRADSSGLSSERRAVGCSPGLVRAQDAAQRAVGAQMTRERTRV